MIFNFYFLSMICCNSAFEQGNLDLWRYINMFIIISITIISVALTKRTVALSCFGPMQCGVVFYGETGYIKELIKHRDIKTALISPLLASVTLTRST